MSLARQRLHKAFQIMREGRDRHESIAYAFKDQLLRLRLEDFPPELRKDFADLVAHICKSGLHNPSTHCRKLGSSVADEEIGLIIDMMATLYINVSSYSPSINKQRVECLIYLS